jgi:hypothetical protein
MAKIIYAAAATLLVCGAELERFGKATLPNLGFISTPPIPNSQRGHGRKSWSETSAKVVKLGFEI